MFSEDEDYDVIAGKASYLQEVTGDF